MNSIPERPSAATRALAAALAVLLRVLLALAGAVFFVSALVAGVIATLVVLVWALLTGRRPAVLRFARGRWRMHAGRGGAAAGATPAARGDVIDVEAREVGPGASRRD